MKTEDSELKKTETAGGTLLAAFITAVSLGLSAWAYLHMRSANPDIIKMNSIFFVFFLVLGIFSFLAFLWELSLSRD